MSDIIGFNSEEYRRLLHEALRGTTEGVRIEIRVTPVDGYYSVDQAGPSVCVARHLDGQMLGHVPGGLFHELHSMTRQVAGLLTNEVKETQAWSEARKDYL